MSGRKTPATGKHYVPTEERCLSLAEQAISGGIRAFTKLTTLGKWDQQIEACKIFCLSVCGKIVAFYSSIAKHSTVKTKEQYPNSSANSNDWQFTENIQPKALCEHKTRDIILTATLLTATTTSTLQLLKLSVSRTVIGQFEPILASHWWKLILRSSLTTSTQLSSHKLCQDSKMHILVQNYLRQVSLLEKLDHKIDVCSFKLHPRTKLQ